jgi:hypothetical protein
MMPPPATNSLIRALMFVAVGILLTLCCLRLWIATYPDRGDPKNLNYVLWKHGLNSDMDLDTALATMTHDTWAVNRVVGLTPNQLKDRFGYVKTFDQARPYLQLCATPNAVGKLANSPNEHDVLYLRDDDWMVVLKNGRAVDLVLCKGY